MRILFTFSLFFYTPSTVSPPSTPFSCPHLPSATDPLPFYFSLQKIRSPKITARQHKTRYIWRWKSLYWGRRRQQIGRKKRVLWAVKRFRYTPTATVRNPTKYAKLPAITYTQKTWCITMQYLFSTTVSERPCEPCLVESVDRVLLASSISSDSYKAFPELWGEGHNEKKKSISLHNDWMLVSVPPLSQYILQSGVIVGGGCYGMVVFFFFFNFLFLQPG